MITHIQDWVKINHISWQITFTFTLFMIFLIPCVSTMAAIKNEIGIKMFLFSCASGFIFPYFLGLIFFQLTNLIK